VSLTDACSVFALPFVLPTYPCCCSLRRAKCAVQAAMRADADDAIDNMQLVDSIYKAAGMPIRQPSSYFLTTGSAETGSQLPAGTKCGGHTALALPAGRGRK
jgi:hypothetical protein